MNLDSKQFELKQLNLRGELRGSTHQLVHRLLAKSLAAKTTACVVLGLTSLGGFVGLTRFLVSFLFIGVTVWMLGIRGHAQEMEVIAGGEIEYQNYCAVCHGVDGRGQGIMRKFLTVPPANLRRLALTSGGKFPFWEVYRKIEGQTEIRGHGTREMPIWGDRFRAQAGGDNKAAQTQAAGRILSLVFYLQHIQE